MRVRGMLLLAAFLILASGIVHAQNIQLYTAKAEQPVGEEVTVYYANLPAAQRKEFYLIFIFGGSGTDFHDSKPLRTLPSGEVKLRALDHAGGYQLVLYRYTDFNDTRPKQLSRVSFKGVVGSRPVTRSAPASATPAVKKPKTEKPVESPPVVKKDAEPKPPTEKAADNKPIVKKPAEPKPVAKKEEVEPQVSPAPAKKSNVSVADTEEENESTGTAGESEEEMDDLSLEPRTIIPPRASRTVITTYQMTPLKTYAKEEPISISFEFPPLNQNEIYQLSVSRQNEKSTINESPALDTSFGVVQLKPIYEDGLYELRVLKSNKGDVNADSIVFRQPLTIGAVNKNYAGRYNCWPRAPKVAGRKAEEAPSLTEAIDYCVKRVAMKHSKPWLSLEDICVEVQIVEYHTPTIVTFLNEQKVDSDLTMAAYPMRFVYRIVVNDYTAKRSFLAEETTEKKWYFYRDSEGKWAVTEQPGTQW